MDFCHAVVSRDVSVQDLTLIKNINLNEDKFNKNIQYEIMNFTQAPSDAGPMPWSADPAGALGVGIQEIDAQHKEIFAELERLAILVAAEAKRNSWHEIHSSLTVLLDRSVMHFGVEESLMHIHGFTDTDAHISQHQEYLSSFRVLLRLALENKFDADTVRTLVAWWEEHVRNADRKYAQWFLRRQAK
jgi:hemerythrin-like metal-binding protein